MKKVKFTVTLTFSENVKESDISEMSRKIADSLRHECDSGNGLAPELSEAFTEKIEVTPATKIKGAKVTDTILLK